MRISAPSIALVMAALTLSCGVLGGGEKYEDATLADAMSGAAPSKTDTYRLASPEVIAVKGGFALLKDGRTIQILAADRLYRYWPDLEGREFHLLVKKWPNPFPHLRLDGYELNGERIDTQWVIAESELPLLVDHRLYDTSFYEKSDVTGWAKTVPRDVVDKKIWVNGGVESIPGIEVAEKEEAAPAGAIDMAEGEEAVEDTEVARGVSAYDADRGPSDVYFILVGGKKLELLPMEEDGVMLLLEGHEAEGRAFGIGGYITELYPKREAEKSGVTGRFQLEVFDFGGKYVLLRN
ncbi:MAG: hypothetical protein ABIK65_09125 [Candidatus Eisenbacteria bacterium]